MRVCPCYIEAMTTTLDGARLDKLRKARSGNCPK